MHLELFTIAKLKIFTIFENDQECLHSCSDFHTDKQSPFLSTGQLSLLYKRDDDTTSLQSVGKKNSKDLTLPQEFYLKQQE